MKVKTDLLRRPVTADILRSNLVAYAEVGYVSCFHIWCWCVSQRSNRYQAMRCACLCTDTLFSPTHPLLSLCLSVCLSPFLSLSLVSYPVVPVVCCLLAGASLTPERYRSCSSVGMLIIVVMCAVILRLQALSQGDQPKGLSLVQSIQEQHIATQLPLSSAIVEGRRDEITDNGSTYVPQSVLCPALQAAAAEARDYFTDQVGVGTRTCLVKTV